MILGLFVAILAYFINAVTTIIDKYLLQGSVPNPLIYCFYVGILSIFAFPLVFLQFEYPGFVLLLIDFLAGFVFLISILLMYFALKKGEASRVIPIIGGLTPSFIYLYNFLIVGDRISKEQLIAIFFLVAGSVLISARIKYTKNQSKKKICFESLGFAFSSAFLLAVYFILADYIFQTQLFISAFAWTRVGSFLGALLFLLFQKNRKKIFSATRKIKIKATSIVIFNKVLGGVAFILLNLAIARSSGLLVNSLSGTQYAFLFLLIIVLSYKYPKIIKEKFNKFIIGQKSLALALIGVGLIFLFTFS
jgi:drug/metabolite transporter (DMT)-like permease